MSEQMPEDERWHLLRTRGARAEEGLTETVRLSGETEGM